MNRPIENNFSTTVEQMTTKAVLILISLLVTIPSRGQETKPDNSVLIDMSYQMYSGIEVKKNADDQLKSTTIIPNSIDVTEDLVKKGIETFNSNLSMKLEKFESNITINGKPQEPARYQVTLSSVVKDFPYYNVIKCDAKWTSVINKKGINILKMSDAEMSKESQKAIAFSRYSQGIYIQYHEGESIAELHGKIKIQIPKFFVLLKLTAADINVENTIGGVKIKLISIDHNIFKIEITGDDKELKIMPVNKEDKEFSMNMEFNIPLALYTEFEKKKKFSPEDLTALKQTVKINASEKVKIWDVSGTISKIYIYKIFDSEIKEISVDLKNQSI